MTQYLLGFVVMFIAILGMAIGALMGRSPIRGSCGGLGGGGGCSACVRRKAGECRKHADEGAADS